MYAHQILFALQEQNLHAALHHVARLQAAVTIIPATSIDPVIVNVTRVVEKVAVAVAPRDAVPSGHVAHAATMVAEIAAPVLHRLQNKFHPDTLFPSADLHHFIVLVARTECARC